MAGFADLLTPPKLELKRGEYTVIDQALKENISFGAASKKLKERYCRKLVDRRVVPNPSGIGSPPIYIYRDV